MTTTLLRGFSIVLTAAALAGCASDPAPKHVAVPSRDTAGTKAFVMTSHGHGVLRLAAASSVKCESADGSLHFNREMPGEVEFWLVPNASTVDDALPRIPVLIKSEFLEFKPAQTTDLTVAGAPAKHIMGKGREADDNDPGAADVVVFKVGPHVFLACNHGESLDAPTQKSMMDMLGTAQLP